MAQDSPTVVRSYLSMDSPDTAKWWHVADKELEDFVTNIGSADYLSKQGGPEQDVASRCAVVPTSARPPRPCGTRVVPGTPLMSHRGTPRPSSAFRARPLSARRSSEPCTPRLQRCDPQCNEGKIVVHVYNMHSSDKLIFRVKPELRIGMAGAACDNCQKDVDRDPSFKCEIAKTLGIEASTIRLMFRGCPLASDDRTLRSCGISDGDIVHLRIVSTTLVGRDDVMLACAAKKRMQDAEWAKDEMLFMRPYAMQSSSSRSRLQQRCEQNGVVLMPKWVSQDNPKLFAPVGVGMDDHGGDCAFEAFNMKGIWHPPVDHPNQRGQNQYGLQRVRDSIMAKRPSYGGA